MVEVLVRTVALIAAAVLWVAGLRLFLRTELSRHHKFAWTAVLLAAGVVIGLLLTRTQVWDKFLLILALLPVLAAVDLVLMRSGRGLTFWVRACGFEVVTVFGLAGATRLLCDRAGFAAFLGQR